MRSSLGSADAASPEIIKEHIINAGLPASALGFEGFQHITIQSKGGRNLGVYLYAARWASWLACSDLLGRMHCPDLASLGFGKRFTQAGEALTDRRFNRMRPSIAPRKRHQAG